MCIYSNIYYSLCHSRSQLIELWKPGSGFHRHHITPRHSGGTDDISNFTFLTVREHIIAHFLLWKIHRNPDDLRSMKMLGANLTVQQRRTVGKWCCDNKIGMYGASVEKRREWRQKGLHSQMNNKNNKNSWWYWSTEEGRKERSSRGGKVGGKKQAELKLGMHQPHIQRKAAILGGKAHKGKKCMYKSGDITFIRVCVENINDKLKEGYILGSPLKPRLNKKSKKPSHRRRKVTDGKTIYDSVQNASEFENISPSAIVYRCKSKKSNWSYV